MKAHYVASTDQMFPNTIRVPQDHPQGTFIQLHSSDEQAEAQGGKETPQATCLELVKVIFEPQLAGVKACCGSMPSLCSCETNDSSGAETGQG